MQSSEAQLVHPSLSASLTTLSRCQHPIPFLHAKAATALARRSHRNSVRPSHGWISQKRCKLGSLIFTVDAWKTLVSETVKLFPQIRGGQHERGR